MRVLADKLFIAANYANRLPVDEERDNHDEVLVDICCEILEENGISVDTESDGFLEFVYRAQELLEIDQNGYSYRWVKQPDGSMEHKLMPKSY